MPRRDVVSVGMPRLWLPLSAITMASAATRSGRRATNSSRLPKPVSSCPSMRTLTPTSRVRTQCRQRATVHDDARLVVGGAAAVQAAGALRRLERGARPSRLVAGRLHVVVRVEQDGGRAGRRGARRVDDRRSTRDLEQLDTRHAGRPQEIRDGRRRLARRRLGEALEGHRGQAHEALEVGAQLGHESGDAAPQVARPHVWLHAVPAWPLVVTGDAPGRTPARAPPTRRPARRW